MICGSVALGVVALALRLELLVRSGWLLEGDDALSTLMAFGVLEGERPIMLKNQTYASAWEPYAMALSYAAFGVSRVSAKLPALLGSLALIGTTWLLARVAVGRTAAWFAALLVAVPPAYDLVLWLKPWAPYTEVILLGSVCLASAIALGEGRLWARTGNSTSMDGRSWPWTRLVRSAAPRGLQDRDASRERHTPTLSPDRRAADVAPEQRGADAPPAPHAEGEGADWRGADRSTLPQRSDDARGATRGRDAWLAFACGMSGGLALWMHPLAVWYLVAAALALLAAVRGSARWPRIVAGGLAGFAIGGLPIWIFNLQTGGATLRFVASGNQGQTADRFAVLGAWWNNDLPRGAGLWHPWGSSPVWLGALLGIVALAALVWAVLVRPRLGWRPLDAVLVFLALIPTIFALSGFGGPALNPWGFDATGRYAPPIWSGLAVVLAALLAALWRVRRWLALAVAAVPVLVNLTAIQSIDPVAAFQSPYWDRLPVDNTPLLDVLAAERVERIWINHWAGQPLMFDARARGQAVYAYDWYDVQAGGIDRFPEYRPLIEAAARPAFVLITDEGEPALEHELRLMGVSFVERRAPPYVVVIPVSRVVHPSEVTESLDYRY